MAVKNGKKVNSFRQLVLMKPRGKTEGVFWDNCVDLA